MKSDFWEQNRRKAFWGLQLKYTFAPVLWLYGSVFVLLVGMFLFNWVTAVTNAESEVSFLEQLSALPLGILFYALITGVQIVLLIGFTKQRKNELAMSRILLPKETKELIRWVYSFFVTLSAFLVYFLMLCLLLVLENCLAPEHAYGMAELYPAFYKFTHLYRIYPVVSALAIPVFVSCVSAVSVMAPMMISVQEESQIGQAVWCGFILSSFGFFCFDEADNPVVDLLLLLIIGTAYIARVVITYQRRQKDDRTEVMERMES